MPDTNPIPINPTGITIPPVAATNPDIQNTLQKVLGNFMANKAEEDTAKVFGITTTQHVTPIPPTDFSRKVIQDTTIPLTQDPSILAKMRTPIYNPYNISTENAAILTAVDSMRLQGRRVNVLVEGLQGTGKTELVNQYAASHNLPLATIEVGRLSETSQIFGYQSFVEGVGVHYVKGLFLEALTTPNCVIHLQELNRPENDTTLNSIYSVLDDTMRSIWLDEIGGYIDVAPGVVVFGTLNEGFEFVGTLPLDAALLNRFHIKIHLGELPEDMEISLLVRKTNVELSQAQEIVKMAKGLRHNTQDSLWVSTRDTLNIATLCQVNLPLMTAMKAVLGLSDEQMEKIRIREHFGANRALNTLTGYTTL